MSKDNLEGLDEGSAKLGRIFGGIVVLGLLGVLGVLAYIGHVTGFFKHFGC